MAAGLGGLGITWREASTESLPAWEGPAFDRVNHLPDQFQAIWPVMQLGNVAAIPVLALATERITHDRRLALCVGIAGFGAYFGAKLVKHQVRRERPAAHRDDVILRENAKGLGFPSGHAAEAVAMATVLAPRVPRGARWLPHALAAGVCFGRLYFGAHLPHDVIGGAALGAAIGGTTNLVLAPVTRPPGRRS